MTEREQLKLNIEQAMSAGRAWDKLSDQAYAMNQDAAADSYGRKAIAAYTRAERYSQTLKALESIRIGALLVPSQAE
jgi:hypothetical protein